MSETGPLLPQFLRNDKPNDDDRDLESGKMAGEGSVTTVDPDSSGDDNVNGNHYRYEINKFHPVQMVTVEFFERELQRFLVGAVSFNWIEGFFVEQMRGFERFLISQVERVQIRLRLSEDGKQMLPLKEDGGLNYLAKRKNPPFFYALTGNRVAHNSGAAALHLDLKVGDRVLKTMHLNTVESDPGNGFGIFSENMSVSPSSLTLFLKYSEEFIDDLTMEEDGEEGHVMWTRTTPIASLLIDYMRENPEERLTLAKILVHHSNLYYYLPLDLARKIKATWEEDRPTPSLGNFCLDIRPVPSWASIIGVMATVDAFRYNFPRAPRSHGGGGSSDGSDGQDQRDSAASSTIEIKTTTDDDNDN